MSTQQRLRNSSNSSRSTPSSHGLMFMQLNDWILGGFLGPTTGYLVVDWMMWNHNHNVVSWAPCFTRRSYIVSYIQL